ncbi:uncharacterized protein BDZ99DRAFT_520427 [Mytilinidion resinicola]|uniref:Uncharacterized protein n=1 Tax=Mytilinidion resinicola TaxID=574789 RepID=A0A6A6YN89_9PEZI|nr:uncharacterized protein BDZ99DRAFT_520427 [Mytilinidion resinicola]KAF2810356.1 hypothetical protein BDZ99DRAFT_520427 [Mytilinidion resinicola]
MPDTSELVVEIFAIIGAPARMMGRLPLITRYVWNGFSSPWPKTPYAEARYGKGYKWRPWLLFDISDFEVVEALINTGSDEKILAFRRSQLSEFQMIALIGALVTQAAMTALQLPFIQQVHYSAHTLLSATVIISLLAVYFTCLQYRTYGFMESPSAIRLWLSNGICYTNSEKDRVIQSSMLSHQLLQVPFELLSIAITLFIVGFGVCLGSAMSENIDLASGPTRIGDLAVFITVMIATVFALTLFGQLLGGKDIEAGRCRKYGDVFPMRHDTRVQDEDKGTSGLPTSPGMFAP